MVLWKSLGILPIDALNLGAPWRILLTGIMMFTGASVMFWLYGYKLAIVDASNWDNIWLAIQGKPLIEEES